MKLIKLSLAAALLAGVALAEDKSDLGISANMALTSNYVWRGMTQTDDAPAVQAGIDLDYKGIYLGTWASNVNFGDANTSMEADVYAGYANDIAGFSYDVGFIYYMYPKMTDELNFAEAYLGLGYDFGVVSIGGKYSYGIDTNDVDDEASNWEPENAWEVTASVPLPANISLDATYGDYDSLGSYYLVGATITVDKFDLSIAYTANDGDGNSDAEQDNFVATVATSF